MGHLCQISIFDLANSDELGAVLLKAGFLLLESGANTDCIKITVDRIASAFGCLADLLIPGVLMIDAISDLLDGHTLHSIVRGVKMLIIAFAIFLGLTVAAYKF